jgi:UDP-2,3-diacylglucosamine pyrophosphatase LpxH
VRRGVVCGESELVSNGVITGGAELMRWAWPTRDQRFSVRHQQETVPAVSGSDGSTKIIIGNPRYQEDLLETHPVDLVVVGHVSRVDPLG